MEININTNIFTIVIAVPLMFTSLPQIIKMFFLQLVNHYKSLQKIKFRHITRYLTALSTLKLISNYDLHPVEL